VPLDEYAYLSLFSNTAVFLVRPQHCASRYRMTVLERFCLMLQVFLRITVTKKSFWFCLCVSGCVKQPDIKAEKHC